MKLTHDGKSTATFLRALADEIEYGCTIINFDQNDWSAIGKMSIKIEWKVDKDGNAML